MKHGGSLESLHLKYIQDARFAGPTLALAWIDFSQAEAFFDDVDLFL